jgi:hypothetical protein
VVETEKSKQQEEHYYAENAPVMNKSQVSGRRGSFSGASLKPKVVNNPEMITRGNWPPTPMPGTQADAEYRRMIGDKSIDKPY